MPRIPDQTIDQIRESVDIVEVVSDHVTLTQRGRNFLGLCPFHDDSSPFKAKVIRKRFRGANILYTLQLQSDEQVLALVSSHHNHSIGKKIGIRPQVDEIILFEAVQGIH